MAPELALKALEFVPKNGVILDPMVGSGTVLRQASNLGLHAVGFDMDPLAVLMSRVWTTPVDDEQIQSAYNLAREMALSADPKSLDLPWIDDDKETRDFIGYWFGTPQADALRCWAWAIMSLSANASPKEAAALDVIRIALSRIIVTKEQCASLARDTSHSRPHKVTESTDYCVHQGLDRSLKTVRKRLSLLPRSSTSVEVALGDARRLTIKDRSVDAVVTSPPYLNAIDYMRGHRLSLVWLGHTLGDLRRIRSDSIGAERAPDVGRAVQEEVKKAMGNLDGLSRRHLAMIDRYIIDVFEMAREIRRVLKPGGSATMVVGNSCLKGIFIKNSAVVSTALEVQGLTCVDETIRELPNQSRYLPTTAGSSLTKRMREETIIRCVA